MIPLSVVDPEDLSEGVGFNKYVELMIMSDSNSFLPARLRTANFLSNVMLSAGTLIRRLLLRCSSHRARSRP